MNEEIVSSIKKMAQQTQTASGGAEAMHYAQAALNLAQAAVTMNMIKERAGS